MKKREKKLQLNRETLAELKAQRPDDEAILTQCTNFETSCPRTTC